MASKSTAAIALLLSLNLLFFSTTNAAIVKVTGCGDRDLSVCVGVLGLGGILTKDGQCCSLIRNILLDVSINPDVCLCGIVKDNILGLLLINVSAQLQLNTLLGTCGCPTKTYNC